MSAGALAGASAGLQLWAGLEQAQSIMFNAGLTRQINEMNIESLELDAINAENFGYTQSARYQAVIDKTIGAQKAGFAAAGVDVSTGTAAVIQAESKLAGFLNQLDIQKAARNKAKGLKLQASNLRLQSIMGQLQAESDASAARIAGVMNAAGTASGYAAGAG